MSARPDRWCRLRRRVFKLAVACDLVGYLARGELAKAWICLGDLRRREYP